LFKYKKINKINTQTNQLSLKTQIQRAQITLKELNKHNLLMALFQKKPYTQTQFCVLKFLKETRYTKAPSQSLYTKQKQRFEEKTLKRPDKTQITI
jgi:hypothetical protein